MSTSTTGLTHSSPLSSLIAVFIMGCGGGYNHMVLVVAVVVVVMLAVVVEVRSRSFEMRQWFIAIVGCGGGYNHMVLVVAVVVVVMLAVVVEVGMALQIWWRCLCGGAVDLVEISLTSLITNRSTDLWRCVVLVCSGDGGAVWCCGSVGHLWRNVVLICGDDGGGDDLGVVVVVVDRDCDS
ncbi:Hypothetical predicted protein [Olea europaea subsp. europaea]|uniref:Transmembrane protein n=1 Tax=Olea europaea subsp. europaea TaxID=158383 RepID=A0A8S0PJZ4_OLEEU|nr:Hypothetical predicted protein [Olea europaea subsp. europaea]